MSVLGALSRLSVESVSLSIAIVILAILGFSVGSILGAGLAYLAVRAIMKSWVRDHPLPPPMQVFLYLLALFGLIGGIQFIVFAAVLIAAFLLKEVKLKAPTVDGFIESTKMALLGVVMPFIGLALPIIPFYESARKFRYDLAGGLALVLLVIIGAIGFYGIAVPLSVKGVGLLSIGGVFNDAFAGLMGPLSASNPLLWAGVIAYEEFVGRVTPFANAMFTLLHMPSRLVVGLKLTGADLSAVGIAFLVLMTINYGARWLWDLYRRHGIIVSIAGHAFYNAAVSSIVDLLTGDPLPVMLLLFVGLVGFLYSLGRRVI
jgi:hypothetical protein